jgi:hypothetical protein
MEEGRAVKKMILGGRYLQENLFGKAMGMPWEGQTTFAYDKLSKRFKILWIDNMGTGMMEGEGDREGDVLTFLASYPDVLGGPDQQYKLVFTVENEEKHSMVLFLLMPNGEFEAQLELNYRRK